MEKKKAALYDQPNKYAKKPSFVPGELGKVEGYQNFLIGRSFVEVSREDANLLAKKKYVWQALNSKWFAGKTVLDLGSNLGYFCFLASMKGAKKVVGVDIDKEYLELSRNVANYYGFENVEFRYSNAADWNEPADLTIALALIHWIYSCSSDYGSLDKAVAKLASLTKEALLIEWVEPYDEAIKFFKHTDFNKEIIESPYDRERFEDALKRHFQAFKIVGEISPTRFLYAAIKNPDIIDDLSSPSNALNLWEVFAELNERGYNYVAARNWELVSASADAFGDLRLDVVAESDALELIDDFLRDYRESSANGAAYKIPISFNGDGYDFLEVLCFRKEDLGSPAFADFLFEKRSRYGPIFGLTAGALFDYILFDAVFGVGASTNAYENRLPDLARSMGTKFYGENLRNFAAVCSYLRKRGFYPEKDDFLLKSGGFRYAFPPERAISSRVLAEKDGVLFASRIYDLGDKIVKQATSELASREFYFLSKLNSKYFPKAKNYVEEGDYGYFELEKIEGFPLSDLSRYFSSFGLEDYKKFVFACIEILEKLDEAGVEHRDVSPDNLMVKSDGIPVLIDFGWAKEKDENFWTPKGLNEKFLPADGVSCDVYAMGKTLDFLDNKFYAFPALIAAMTEEDADARVKDPAELKKIYREELERKKPRGKASIIIPVYNNLEYTRKAIESIYSTAKLASFEIIAFDNGSTDGTKEYFEELAAVADNFSFIRSEENLGFAKANNRAMELASGEYVVFFNNDVVAEKGWLDKAISILESDEKIAMVGALLLYPNSDQIQHCGATSGVFEGKTVFYHKHQLRSLRRVPEALRTREAEIVTAALAVARKKAVEEVGKFDENFLNGFEDVDLCLKLREKGYKIIYSGSVRGYHYESRTAGRRDKDEENYRYLVRKWGAKLVPKESPETTYVDLNDIWLRKEALKNPDDVGVIAKLAKIARWRGNQEEFEEFARLVAELKRKKEKPKFSVVIPVYNNLEFTRKCVNSLLKNAPDGVEIIIFDNGSTDGTKEYLKELSAKNPRYRFIRNEENLGFAKACNAAADIAAGEYILFLNNDVEIEAGFFEAAEERFRSDPKIGIVGAKLLYPDGSIQHCGIEFQREKGTYLVWPQHRYRGFKADDPLCSKAEEVQAVTGAAMFVESRLFKEIGGFSTDYPMYFEDVDLCFKARDAGAKIFYEPKCVATHYEGATIKDKKKIRELNLKSAEIFWRKRADEIARITFETFVERRRGKFVYLSRDFIPSVEDMDSVNGFINVMTKVMPPFYAHFGGIGDALLVLSSALDEEEEIAVVSFPNDFAAMKSFFDVFEKIKIVYFVDWRKDYLTQAFARAVFPKFKNFKGMGATPESLDLESEWNASLNVFKKYGVKKNPNWAKNFAGEKSRDPQIVLAPSGSLSGMPSWKKNWIPPEKWSELLAVLEKNGVKPIIIGSPRERENYPAAENSEDKRDADFAEQMKIIASADLLIAADSWHKTFAALAGVESIVFRAVSAYGKSFKDASEYVFVKPWDKITQVADFDEFLLAFEAFLAGKKYKPKPRGRTSFDKSFWTPRYSEVGSVLIKCPAAVGDSLSITAVVRNVKRKYPNVKIAVSGDLNARDIFKNNPNLENFVLSGSEEEFIAESMSDKIVDYNDAIRFLPEYFNVLPYFDILGNIAGVKLDDKRIDYYPEEAEIDAAKKILGESEGKPVIGLHLRTAKDERRSYARSEELLAELASSFPRAKFVVFGAEKNDFEENARTIDCAKMGLDLRTQFALAGECDSFICVDSAFFHIAHNFYARPTLVIVGPTNPKLIGNDDANFDYISADNLDCLSCYWRYERNIECMKDLAPSEIVSKFKNLLENGSRGDN